MAKTTPLARAIGIVHTEHLPLMHLLVTIRIACRALRKNKMRAGLTILGVVIGIAAVTTMVSIGQSANNLLHNELESMGTNVLLVFRSGRRDGPVHQGSGTGGDLTADDAAAIAEECPSVLAVSPVVAAGGHVIYGNTNWSPERILGVGTDHMTVGNWTLRRGGFFSEQDIASAAKVCVIGHTLVAELFQTTNPIDETIRVRNIPFRVIGVLEPKGAALDGRDQDNLVLAPYTTVRKRLSRSGRDNIDVLFISARSVDRMDDAEEEIEQLLYERHRIPPGEPADFDVMNTTEIANMLSTFTGTMTLLLAAIAGISLVVGGVGVMNIMLVSVTERTREIGIRLAVGARGRDILWQFLIESIVLASVGGVIGVGLGISGSMGITAVLNSLMPSAKWPVVISLRAALIAMLFSGAVGVFFGFYPALRASRMDPIDALRYE